MGYSDNESLSDSGEFDDIKFSTPHSEDDVDESYPRLDWSDGHTDDQPIENRDESWDMGLCNAIRGDAAHAVEGVERALDNRADVNALCEDDMSNLAWALKCKPMGPAREEVVRLLLKESAVFTDDDEQRETFMDCAIDLSPRLFQDLLFSERFKAVKSNAVLSTMHWLVITNNPNACALMRMYIYQAQVIFSHLKEKMKTNDGSKDEYSDDGDDEEDEYNDLDDFLSKRFHGHTLLHMVVDRHFDKEDCIPLLHIIIDNGARLNEKNRDGVTPTELAKQHIGSHPPTRHGKQVVAMLEYAEDRQKTEAREIEDRKFELIAMTTKERIGRNSIFERVDPEVIRMILEARRDRR